MRPAISTLSAIFWSITIISPNLLAKLPLVSSLESQLTRYNPAKGIEKEEPQNGCLVAAQFLCDTVIFLCTIINPLIFPWSPNYSQISACCSSYQGYCTTLYSICKFNYCVEEGGEGSQQVCCGSDAQCAKNVNQKVCDLTTNMCTGCTSSSDCPWESPICEDGKCRACSDDYECWDSFYFTNPYCLDGKCVGCVSGDPLKKCYASFISSFGNPFWYTRNGNYCQPGNWCGCKDKWDCYNSYDFTCPFDRCCLFGCCDGFCGVISEPEPSIDYIVD